MTDALLDLARAKWTPRFAHVSTREDAAWVDCSRMWFDSSKLVCTQMFRAASLCEAFHRPRAIGWLHTHRKSGAR